MKLSEMGEFGLIERIYRENKRADVIKGIGDDAAVIRYGNEFLLYTTDMMVEGSHFIKSLHPPYKLGRKAMESNVSDIAAMGGIPEYAMVSIALRKDEDVEFVDDLYRGIYEVADRYSIEIIGGDTVSSDGTVISIALMGRTDKEHLTLRSGAKVGDYILVSGPLGASRAGLELLKKGLNEPKGPIEKHLDPGCRMDMARDVALHANAMIDISDGLASEIRHICEESGVGAVIEKDRIPIDDETVEASKILGVNPYEYALRGGEDYELLFTVSERNLDAVKGYGGVIGRIAGKGVGIKIRDENGKMEDLGNGYEHFRE